MFGNKTNNEAEYLGLIHALDWIIANQQNLDFTRISFYFDSQLIARQMDGSYKVKALNLKKIYQEAKEKERKIKAKITYNYLPRERNFLADSLLNKALDCNLDS